jgi:hypothetical protein
MGDNTEMGALAVTEELHAKQQRKAPQDAANRPLIRGAFRPAADTCK